MPFTLRRLRLASGLVLLTYITLHLVNHALGIWSLDLAEAGLVWAKRLWLSLPGTILLYGAAGAHFLLALRTVYERRHWRLPAIEWVRLWAGFGLPLLLIDHVVGTRIAASFYAFDPTYERTVGSLVAGNAQGWQIALLAPGWLHGCLGLWLSLRRVEVMRHLKPVLIALVVALPLLSGAGFIAMSRAVEAVGPVAASAMDRARAEELDRWRHGLVAGYAGLIVAAFLAGRLRGRDARAG